MILFLIGLIIVIYILIAIAIYKVCAANNTFDEFGKDTLFEKPVATILFSIFWIITLPVSIICAIFRWIAEQITGFTDTYHQLEKEYFDEKKKKS